MPFDPAGIASLPPSTWASPGQTIRTEQHNPPFRDIEAMLSAVLKRDGRDGMVGPLSMGGFPINNVGSSTSPTAAATVSQLLPVGSVIDFALPLVPGGWLLCDGQVLTSATPYPDLRSALINAGFPYGQNGGDPRIPDFRGRVAAGRDNMGGSPADRLTAAGSGVNGATLGAAGGEQGIILTTGQLPEHAHGAGTLATGPAGSHFHTLNGASSNQGVGNVAGSGNPTGTVQTSTAPNHTHPITGSTAAVGNGEAHRNVQPTLVMNKIIKAAH